MTPSRERFFDSVNWSIGMGTFYNTTSETGPQLAEYQAKASEQNAVVLWLFQKARRPLSPSEVHDAYPCPLGLPQPPLTSIRRAITTLTQAGTLVKTEVKRKGMFGRNEFCWCLPEAGQSPGQAISDERSSPALDGAD